MCWAYNRQHGTQYLAAMPTNIYGPGDNYDLHTAHVIPALIRKMHEAKMGARRGVVVWGSGSPRREFLYSGDLAEACLFLMNLVQKEFDFLVRNEIDPPVVNVGSGRDRKPRCKLVFGSRPAYQAFLHPITTDEAPRIPPVEGPFTGKAASASR